MPRKKKVGRPPGRAKPRLLSVRISQQMRDLLAQAAWENKRSVSREVEARLDYTLARYRKGKKVDDLMQRIRGLLDAVAFTARVIEAETERPWNEDQYTSQHLSRAISSVIADFTLPGEVTIPQKVLERAKNHAAGEAYPDCFGEETAKGIIAQLRLAFEPSQYPSPPMPEFLTEFWKIRRDLEPRRKR
jgi:hypothetical protein